jgi:hypothetical protein
MTVYANRPDLKPYCLNHAEQMAEDVDEQTSSR